MHITLVDDSIPFDGYTASSRPLGGAEKAFAALAGALARRGHKVQVFNRCRWSMYVEGAQWETFESKRPLMTDLLIALRKPELLGFVRQAGRRVLWHVGPGRQLNRRAVRAHLDDFSPTLLLCSPIQAQDPGGGALPQVVLPPGLKSDFLAPADGPPADPPRAIVTTHPAHGLDWLLDLWAGRIQPERPDAELHIHSLGLSRAADNEPGADPALAALAARAAALQAQGVRLIRPQGDGPMAQAYRRAAVHLYPGHVDDCTAFTLMESQACGTPAVCRPWGAAPLRLADGQSGYVAPDDAAFANLTVLLLGHADTRDTLGAAARRRYEGCDWDKAAAKLEAALA